MVAVAESMVQRKQRIDPGKGSRACCRDHGGSGRIHGAIPEDPTRRQAAESMVKSEDHA
jgi:hypothetical protein